MLLGLNKSSGSSLFTPLSLSNTELWLDSDDASTITEDIGRVAQWDDKSKNGLSFTEANTTKRPDTGSDTIGGVNALTFDGVDDALNDYDAGAGGLAIADTTIFMVRETIDTSYITLNDATTRYTLVADQGSADTILSQGVGSATYYKNNVLQSITTRGDAYTAYNGAAHIAMYDGYDLSSIVGLEISGYGGLEIAGKMGDIVILSSASAADKLAILDYLSEKYSIAITKYTSLTSLLFISGALTASITAMSSIASSVSVTALLALRQIKRSSIAASISITGSVIPAGGAGWDVVNATYSTNSLDTSTQIDAGASTAMCVNPDGDIIIAADYFGTLYEYTATTGWDMSTASYSSNSFGTAANQSGIRGLCYNNDGSKLYVTGSNPDRVSEYNLGTNYSISGTVTHVANFALSGTPQGGAWSSDGTKFVWVESIADVVTEYDASTAWDVSTLSAGSTYDCTTEETGPKDYQFGDSGDRGFVVGNDGDKVNTYTMSTSYDISTLTAVSTFSLASQDLSPISIKFNPTGTKMLMYGSTNEKVFEYDVPAF